MDPVIRAQILGDAVCISYTANTFEKGMLMAENVSANCQKQRFNDATSCENK